MGDWISERSGEDTLRVLDSVQELLSGKGGSLTRAVSLVYQRSKLELVNYKFEYSEADNAEDAFYARCIHALFAKQEWMSLGIDTQAVAEKKFWDAEAHCSKVNDSLRLDSLNCDVFRVVVSARRKIRAVLGKVPRLSELEFSFGPGATTSVKSREANAIAKLSANLACSEELLPRVGAFLAEVPLWVWSQSGLGDKLTMSDDTEELIMYPEIEIHHGKLTFVPKDARSKRPVVVEPVLNGFFQKGVGLYLKRRLLSVAGINLLDQSINQNLARIGSEDGSYATIDLSSASDTVSLGVVRLLLPEEWFDFLLGLTTGKLQIGTDVRELHKFSSMGNGFTFELESLLFWSVAKACSELLGLESDVSVYGDDIIVGSRAYNLVYESLTALGFFVNSEKSFAAGPFRESCGADWFKGTWIRPFYVKQRISDETLYTHHNWAMRVGERDLANLLLSHTQPELRVYGPDGYGDGHLIGSYELRRNRKLRRNGWGGGFFDTYHRRPKRIHKRRRNDWVYPSYSVYTRASERDYTDPDIVRGSNGYAKVSIYTTVPGVFAR
jgi:hypothetical protein